MKYTKKNKLQCYEKNNKKKTKLCFCYKILPSVVSHKKRKAFGKLFILSEFIELFPLIILVKIHFEFHGEMTEL